MSVRSLCTMVLADNVVSRRIIIIVSYVVQCTFNHISSRLTFFTLLKLSELLLKNGVFFGHILCSLRWLN